MVAKDNIRYLHLLVVTSQRRIYRLTSRREKLVQSRPLQEKIFVLILGF